MKDKLMLDEKFLSENHVPKDFTGFCTFSIDLYKGARYYYKNGLLHSEDDNPAIIHKTGSKFWYKNGKLHREEGPAIEYSVTGNKYYVYEGYHYPSEKAFKDFKKSLRG